MKLSEPVKNIHAADQGEIIFFTTAIKVEWSRHRLLELVKNKLHQANYQFTIVTHSNKDLLANPASAEITYADQVIELASYRGIFRYLKVLTLFFQRKPKIVLIGGYGYAILWWVALISLLFNAKRVVWTGSGKQTRRSDSGIKTFLKKIFVLMINQFLTYGSESAAYLRELGVDRGKIIKTVNVGNITTIKAKSESYAESHADKTTIHPAVEQTALPIIVYAGRLEENKGIKILVSTLTQSALPFQLYIAGSGKLHPWIADRAAKDSRIHYVGQLEPDQLIEILSQAQLFVQPTLNDPFSRIISEAIACGCYVAGSIYDDASYDLITPSNGVILDPLASDYLQQLETALTQSTCVDRKLIRNSLMRTEIMYSDDIIQALLS